MILATNIAERYLFPSFSFSLVLIVRYYSSVTVKDIRYVIDLGFVKEIFYDPQTNLESLKLQYASKASAIQVSSDCSSSLLVSISHLSFMFQH